MKEGRNLEELKVSDLFFNNIMELPLWVKQIVHLRANQELKNQLEDYMHSLNPEQLLQQIVPKLTYGGRMEIEEPKNNITNEQYIFLMNAGKGYDVFEIALTNFWSLEQVCKYYTRMIELELVEYPNCQINSAILNFLAGQIKTGDILRKLRKVDTKQIELALKEQKKKQDQGINAKFADVMIELGFIQNKDVEILLRFKEESKKRFIMGLGLSTLKIKNDKDGQMIANNMQRELKRLVHENTILKNRLKKILNIKG